MVVALAALGVGYWLLQDRLSQQWGANRVASAVSFEAAGSLIASMENAPDREERLRKLVEAWGRGHQKFDLYLAWYVTSPRSSELLRETFSLELAWREELLPRWAHYWCWRSPQAPDEQIASVLGYLELLAQAETPKEITWREVLDLQAIFALADQPGLAKRLSPDNWLHRFRQWEQSGRPKPSYVHRPEEPFPDWQGPVPDRRRLVSQ